MVTYYFCCWCNSPLRDTVMSRMDLLICLYLFSLPCNRKEYISGRHAYALTFQFAHQSSECCIRLHGGWSSKRCSWMVPSREWWNWFESSLHSTISTPSFLVKHARLIACLILELHLEAVYYSYILLDNIGTGTEWCRLIMNVERSASVDTENQYGDRVFGKHHYIAITQCWLRAHSYHYQWLNHLCLWFCKIRKSRCTV